MHNSLSIDEIIEATLEVCKKFEDKRLFVRETQQLTAIKSRLYRGEIHIAVIGQFNRGKSTFINKLLQSELLPSSVLPLTSLSTQIVYRETKGYEISFQDGTKLDEEADDETIQKIVTDYVAESANPKNHKKVRNIKVGCPSDLLAHGTRIIDTPGFGSTHIHNTKATLDLLKECDAVLFMLSADLPITQIELNFLKRIQPHITRLFFIYNKKDLLNSQELTETTHFIQETLRNQLQIESRDIFFTISAREADEDREASGITNIEENILGFLEREKYFSLAEAIDKKLKDTQHSIEQTLQSAIEELEQKQIHALNECEALSTEIEQLQQKHEATEGKASQELLKFREHLFTLRNFSRETTSQEFDAFFDRVCKNSKIRSFNELIPLLQSEAALLFVNICHAVTTNEAEILQDHCNNLFEESNLHYSPSLQLKNNPSSLPAFFSEQKEGLHIFQSSNKRLLNIKHTFDIIKTEAIEAFITHMKTVIKIAIADLQEDITASLQKSITLSIEKLQKNRDSKRGLTQKCKASQELFKTALSELPML